MRIGQIVLRVSDLERSLDFWAAVFGLELKSRAGTFAFLDGGDVQLALNEIGRPVDDDSLTEIVFELDDIEAGYGELSERGVPFEVEPRAVMSDGSSELWAAHFHDPDGHLASVVGWVGPGPPSAD